MQHLLNKDHKIFYLNMMQPFGLNRTCLLLSKAVLNLFSVTKLNNHSQFWPLIKSVVNDYRDMNLKGQVY